MGYPKIDKLLLVGGSTYMPQVIERVKKEFSIEARMFDPNLAVAKGAAIFGYKCLLENELKARLTDPTDRDTKEVDLGSVPEAAREEAERSVAKDFGLALGTVKNLTRTEIINVSSKSFGLVVVDTARGIEVVNNLVVKDDPVPRRITREFGTLEDRQTQVDLQVMENQIRTQPSETLDLAICEEIGVAALKFDRPLPKNSPIEVTFDLGPDGLLKMDAKDLTTGGAIYAEFKTKSIMSQEELQQSRSRSLAASLS
jgi:molecular chaperone DnaK (HSP70)